MWRQVLRVWWSYSGEVRPDVSTRRVESVYQGLQLEKTARNIIWTVHNNTNIEES